MLLSTVAVGILTFTYSQYAACRASLASDSARFARLSEELVFRVGPIYGVTLMNNLQAGTYLVAEVRHLLRKLHQFDQGVPNKNSNPPGRASR